MESCHQKSSLARRSQTNCFSRYKTPWCCHLVPFQAGVRSWIILVHSSSHLRPDSFTSIAQHLVPQGKDVCIITFCASLICGHCKNKFECALVVPKFTLCAFVTDTCEWLQSLSYIIHIHIVDRIFVCIVKCAPHQISCRSYAELYFGLCISWWAILRKVIFF